MKLRLLETCPNDGRDCVPCLDPIHGTPCCLTHCEECQHTCTQPNKHYKLIDAGYGAEILAPNDETVAFLQGDDYDSIMREEEEVSRIWSRRFGKGYRKSYGPFKSYEDHMDAVLSQYDC